MNGPEEEFVTLPATPPRTELLEEAIRLTTGDRNRSYGGPVGNFTDISAIWNVQISHKLKEPLTTSDVAALMIGVKMARIKASPTRDNWADAAGYAACGFECDVVAGRIVP